MKSFFAAIMFLTRIPLPSISVQKEDWQKSVKYYPIVGLLIGVLHFLLLLASQQIFSPVLSTVLFVIFSVWITGGLHLDGWMDLADGLGSNQPKEKVMEIMKDSRVGAMGVIALSCLLLLKLGGTYELLQVGNMLSIILPFMISRNLLIYAIFFFPYLNENKGGLGKGLKENVHFFHIFFMLLFVLIISYILSDWIGVFVVISSHIVGFLFLAFVSKKLNGLNGDCYGACVEFTEAVSLLCLAFAWRLFG